MASTSKYQVRPTNGAEPHYTVEADRMEHEAASGATLLYKGTDLVARIYNASIIKNPVE